MTSFRCAADSDHQVQADRSLDVCCQVVRTGACDPEQPSSKKLQSCHSARLRKCKANESSELESRLRQRFSGLLAQL